MVRPVPWLPSGGGGGTSSALTGGVCLAEAVSVEPAPFRHGVISGFLAGPAFPEALRDEVLGLSFRGRRNDLLSLHQVRPGPGRAGPRRLRSGHTVLTRVPPFLPWAAAVRGPGGKLGAPRRCAEVKCRCGACAAPGCGCRGGHQLGLAPRGGLGRLLPWQPSQELSLKERISSVQVVALTPVVGFAPM